ncbi:MAG: ATP-binding cassette domain-containing protein, partial [Pseudomonadota bacterium]
VNGRQKHVASYLKEFLFLPEQARSPVKVLSGGERARLMLAKSLSQASNLLVLDEPTNDLDLETLDLLQELLSDYAGTLLLVSHDRDFLDRVCTSVLAFEGNGRWVEYAGGFTDMMHQGGGAFMRPSHAHDGGPSSQIKPKLTRTPDAKQATTQRKLSYKEKHALETLPSRMEELAARKSELETELADPALYQRNPDRFSAASDALDQTQQALDAAEEQWLELEMKREALEA